MDGDFVPLVVVEAHPTRLDVHLLFAIGQAHSQRDAAVTECQVQVVGAVTWIQEGRGMRRINKSRRKWNLT